MKPIPGSQARGARAKESAYDFLGSNIIIHQMPDDKVGKRHEMSCLRVLSSYLTTFSI
jgi:hypothetical protein